MTETAASTFFAPTFPTSARPCIATLATASSTTSPSRAGLGHNTRFVGWGCAFFDFDNDGWKDLLLVNGHVFPEIDRLGIDIRFRDRAILYRNTGKGTFEDISERAGAAIASRHSARGLAVGDIDNDGTLEVLVNNQNEPPSLWKQADRAAGHWLLVKLAGSRSNRSAIGARVMVSAGGPRANRRSAQRRQLPLAERSAAALRAGQRHARRFNRPSAGPPVKRRFCGMWPPIAW